MNTANSVRETKILFVICSALLLGGVSCSTQPIVQPQEPVICTQEAKVCPDGSYVGRTGPNCEFTACPVETSQQTGDILWKTSFDNATGLLFQYPERLSAAYFHATVGWPPMIVVSNAPFQCTEGGSLNNTAGGKTQQRRIVGHVYCVTESSEGAAGSTYTDYTYAFSNNNKTVSLSFTIQSVQCDNYDEPQRSACKSERETFSIDAIADRMATSVEQGTVSTTGWKSYQNTKFGFSIKYPSTWKKGEYTFAEGNEGVVGIAFDPVSVVSEESYRTLDMAPGMIWIYFDDSYPFINTVDAYRTTTVGTSGIPARYLKIAEGDAGPNPWWKNKTDLRYYVRLPEKNRDATKTAVVLAIHYPDDKETDLVTQQTIDTILSSFDWIQ